MNFYYENSNGRKIDLNKPPFIGVLCNNLFEFKWDYVTQGQAVKKIVKFEKLMKQKKFQILINGRSEYEYLGYLEQFLQLTDVDINNLQKGKLWIDDYYLEGYIFASSKPKQYLHTDKTLIECTLICEKANWQSEEVYRFYANGRSDSDEHDDYTYGIYYPYDIPYDYAAPFGINTILNESYFDTDFEITFYGVNPSPEVTIGGQKYKVSRALAVDDRMVINSKEKTITIIRKNGNKENAFRYRDRNHNIFEKIKSGGNNVIKPRNVAIDVKLFYERSEPKYTENKWT